MKKTVYIGIDDTDIIGGPGTGRVARGLAEFLENLNAGFSKGVIRHQLLVDPRIPYTSHNSSKCILFETENSPLELIQPCVRYLTENFQKGSDPGLCIGTKEQATGEVIAYGQRAQTDFIPKRKAIELAKKDGIPLTEVGGTGDGIVGALAAFALTAGGNDGRFVQLRGIKEIEGLVTVAQVKANTDTVRVIDERGHTVADKEIIDSNGWLRPSLVDGQPVLRVRLTKNSASQRLWELIEQRMHSEHEGGD